MARRAPRLSLAPLVVLALALADGAAAANGTAHVRSGSEFARALADAAIWTIFVDQTFIISDADWTFTRLPIDLRRNVSVMALNIGPAAPTIDLNFVRDKVTIASGLTFALYDIVINRYRESLPSQTPGFDLIGATSLPKEAPPGVLLLVRCTLVNRGCFPPAVSLQNTALIPRPPEFPGVQHTIVNLPPPYPCVNDSAAPLQLQCHETYRLYVDIAVYGHYEDPTYGKILPTNYYMIIRDTNLMCPKLMPASCVETLGPLGCYASLFPRTPLASDAPLATVDGQPRRPHTAAAVIAGCVCAGVLLLAALLAAVVLSLRSRRWQSERLPPEAADARAAGAGASDGRLLDSVGIGTVKGGGGGQPAMLGTKDVSDSGGDRTSLSVTHSSVRADRAAAAAADVWGFAIHDVLPVTPLTPQHVRLLGHESGAAGSSGGAAVNGGGLGAAEDSGNGSATGAEGAAAPGLEGGSNELRLLPDAVCGKGACGRVVEGVYGGQRVAVKLLADMHQWAGPADALIKFFTTEVEVLGRCDHPNIVKLLAACLQPPRLCLVMELMDMSLERLLYGTPGRLLPLPVVLHIGIEVARGLEYLHPTITHRDLKPANVLLRDAHGPRPQVKLADFGLARLRSTVQPTRTPGAGTPAYLAPECYEASIITHQADIFSMGVLLWECLAGRRPWANQQAIAIARYMSLHGKRLPLDELTEERCPRKLRCLIAATWEYDPRRRPAAAEVAKGLVLVLKSIPSGGAGQGAPTGSATPGPHHAAPPSTWPACPSTGAVGQHQQPAAADADGSTVAAAHEGAAFADCVGAAANAGRSGMQKSVSPSHSCSTRGSDWHVGMTDFPLRALPDAASTPAVAAPEPGPSKEALAQMDTGEPPRTQVGTALLPRAPETTTGGSGAPPPPIRFAVQLPAAPQVAAAALLPVEQAKGH